MPRALVVPARYLVHEIAIETFIGFDDYGAPSYTAPAQYRARIVARPKMIRDATGQEVVSNSQAFVYPIPDPKPSVKDRITLPDGSQPLILVVVTAADAVSDHHLILYT
jgi:hypothetical protein